MTRAPFRDRRQLLFPWSPRFTISAFEAARLLNVSHDTICRMITDGSIEAEKMNPEKPKSYFRVNYDSVVAHVEKLHTRNRLAKRF